MKAVVVRVEMEKISIARLQNAGIAFLPSFPLLARPPAALVGLWPIDSSRRSK